MAEDINGVTYRARQVGTRKDGAPVWHAAATAQGHHGYGNGTSEEEAKRLAKQDLLRKIHGGLVERRR